MNTTTHLDEVLGAPCPIAGQPDAATTAAVWLDDVARGCDEYLASMRAAQQQLVVNSGETVSALDSKIEVAALSRATVLGSAARAGHIALLEYGEQIERIHRAARVACQSCEELLAEIGRCLTTIEGIASQLGVSIACAWYTAPPVEAPTAGSLVAAVPLSSLEGQLAQVARAQLEDEWRTAALRWRAALDDLHRLRAQWQQLQRQRIDCEHHLTSSLHVTGLGSALQFTPGVGEVGSGVVTVGAVRSIAPVAGTPSADVSTRRHHPLLMSLYEGRTADHVLGRALPPHVVERWWHQLSDRDRQTLIAEVPLVIGNLDGVPLEARVSANAVTARSFARAAGISAQEASYWQRVSDGAVQLVVSDPQRSRIVEMIGQPSPQTQRVVTYLPGTGTQMKHFYAGEVQRVADYLVRYSSTETVVFVYKDGPWVSWAGPNRNTSYDFLGRLGGQVTDFQHRVLARDPRLMGVSRVAMGHSAGMSVISGAELTGSRFDQVLSLGGSFMLDEWQPAETTDYHHFQYDNDVINRIDDGRLRTPHELRRVYQPHIFDSEGKAEMQSHGRIAEGRETNEHALRQMLRVIEDLERK